MLLRVPELTTHTKVSIEPHFGILLLAINVLLKCLKGKGALKYLHHSRLEPLHVIIHIQWLMRVLF